MAQHMKPMFRFGFSNAIKADRFPEKVYDVAEDNYLIRWNPTGTSILVDENGFSDLIMECYPGFLQIPDFPNFRRLFREYSFDWDQRGTIFEYSHPFFIRGKPELLCQVLTKRRSFHQTPYKAPSVYRYRDEMNDSSDSETSGIRTRRGFIPFQKSEKKTISSQLEMIFDEKKTYKIHERPSVIKPNERENMQIGSMQDEEEEEILQKGTLEENKKAIENIINVFAINELSPEEFLEYLQRKPSLISTEQEGSAAIHFALPSIKSKDKSLTDIPSTANYQIDDFAFTQIRAATVSSPPNEEFLTSSIDKQYHNMEKYSIPFVYNGFQYFNEEAGDGFSGRTQLKFKNNEPCCQCRCHKT